MVKNPIPAKITELASAIIRLVTTHENKIGSSTQKGHTQAGGAPQAIGTSLSAGTDNGYYARADHVHTINYSNILNKPTTFPPSSHNHDNTYYTKEEVDDLLNDVLLDRIFVDENGDLVIGTTIAGMLLNANKNIIQSNETSTLTATAYDAYSDVVVDQPLQLYKDDTLVGIFNTNNNGQIQYTYTGDGSGKHNFIVRNGRFVSETLPVLDCSFYDIGTTGTPDNRWYKYGTTSSSDDTGTTVNRDTTGNGYYVCNATSINDYPFSQGICCEFEIVSVSNARIQVSDQIISLSNGDTVKFTVNNNQYIVTKNGIVSEPVAFSYDTFAIRFQMMGVSSITYKNWKIYPI